MTNTQKPIPHDAVVRRLYAQGRWRLESVAHFGGDETGIADMCLLKDGDGKPFIPGSSIAGSARSFLARQHLEWADYSHKDGIKNEQGKLKSFFGGPEKGETVKDSDPMSALIVADAMCVPNTENTSIRDGVRIVPKSGVAADGEKYDVEVVERGTEFNLEFVCIIRKGDNQSELVELFLAMLYGFQEGEIQLGARTRRGYGQGKVKSWDIRDLHMDNQKDVMAWLRDDPWSQPNSDLTPEPLPKDQRRFFRIEADFQLRTSLLIRSSSGNPKAPDMVHLHSDGKPVIPGTSFAGAFRHRVTLIAKTIGLSEKVVDQMFGYVYEKGNGRQEADARAGRVWIEEHLVTNVETQWQDRIAIDRFTGGSLQSALFNQKPVYPCRINSEPIVNVRLRLTLEEPENEKAEIGLLLLTLRDFWYGHAALGGETSNGRGALQGITAKLIYKDDPNPDKTKEWKLEQKEKSMTIESGDASFLQSYVDKAQNNKERPEASRRPHTENSEEKTDAE